MTENPLQNLLSVTENSPLREADPASLDELMRRAEIVFNMRPLDLSEADIDAACDYYRAKRGHFAQLARDRENAPKPARGRKSSTIAEALARVEEVEP